MVKFKAQLFSQGALVGGESKIKGKSVQTPEVLNTHQSPQGTCLKEGC